MCYNCGCGIPEDNMGKGELRDGGGSLVEADFEHMAKTWEMNTKETKMNVLNLLKRSLGVK